MPRSARPRLERPPPRWAPRGALLLVAGLTLAACSLPTTEAPPPENDPAQAPIGSSTPDPAREALLTEVERLRATVTAARDELAAAVDAADVGTAQRAADAALGALVADADAAATGDDALPLFPADSPDRHEADDAADQLTVTLTRARDVGGSLGTAVVDALRDPIAGDLGAWQRDAAGVLAGIEATAAEASTLEEHEAAIGELAGLGPRAIAWTHLTADAPDAATATDYAERGVANLEVILVRLEELGS